MGFDDLVDCSCFISSAIGQAGVSAGQASHAIGELSKALNVYGSSLPCRQSTVKRMANIVCASIVRKSGLPERQITDVLEKNFEPLSKGDIVFHKDGWNFN